MNLSDADRLREERNKARAAELAMARGEAAHDNSNPQVWGSAADDVLSVP